MMVVCIVDYLLWIVTGY